MKVVPLIAVVLATALALPASGMAQVTERPSLPKDADPNDWEAYYNAAVQHLANDVQKAEAEFAWASRLRPDRPEPFIGRWVASWAGDLRKFQRYIEDDEKVLRESRTRQVDSLRARAMWRNPFVHQGLVFLLYDRLPGRFNENAVIRGWIALAQADLPRAVSNFGLAVRRDPRRNRQLRFVRASAFVNLKRLDSAAVELDSLLAQLRAEDDKKLGDGYQSKALLEHARGLLHLATRQNDLAREAFARALLEDASFAPSHAMLAEMAIAARDSAAALLEYALAMEIAPGDVEYVLGFGKALRLANRNGDAAEQFRKAVAMEPLYASPYFLLADALEGSGDSIGAIAAYEQFLVHAARSDVRRSEAYRKRQALIPGPP